MHESFQRAIRPRTRFSVLRIPLKPLTLGHLFLLHEINSPLIQGKPHLLGDLLIAVFICSHWDAEDARRNLWRFWWTRIFAIYWGFRCRFTDVEKEWKKFFDYINSERERPPTRTPEASCRRELAAPWEWVLLDFLCSTYGWTERVALRLPLVRANALWCVHNDSEGKVSLATAPGGIEPIIKGIWARRRAAMASQNKEAN